MFTVAHPTARTLNSVIVGSCHGRLVGVEREYEVWRAGETVDVRALWDNLPDPGVWLDPSDARARRGPWGGVLTADGPHAELATPPVTMGPGSTRELVALAASGERHLAAQLPEHRLVGYSTHINVEVADRSVVRVARLIAGRLALPLMLGLDRRDSPGLLVRPRPGRLEVGGEFAAGDQLRAAVVLTIGMVLLAESAIGIRRGRIPYVPPAKTERAVERFGWYVDRKAFGPDLYVAGRATALGPVTAGEVVARLWSAARPMVADHLDDEELEVADRVVSGERPIPMEQPTDRDGPTPEPAKHSYLPHRRGDLELSVHRATWSQAVLRVRTASGTRWITVPGRTLDAVLDAFDGGLLDDDLRRLTR